MTDALTNEELLVELERRLREYDDPTLIYADGVFVVHRWDGEVQDPPLFLHVGADQLGRRCRIDEQTRDALWPDSPVELAGLNLLFVHLDEVISLAREWASQRRHVVLEPRLAVVTDPAVPDEEEPSRPPTPPVPPVPLVSQLPVGEYGWYAYALLSQESFPPGGEPSRAEDCEG